jgi:hypothetical protein
LCGTWCTGKLSGLEVLHESSLLYFCHAFIRRIACQFCAHALNSAQTRLCAAKLTPCSCWLHISQSNSCFNCGLNLTRIHSAASGGCAWALIWQVCLCCACTSLCGPYAGTWHNTHVLHLRCFISVSHHPCQAVYFSTPAMDCSCAVQRFASLLLHSCNNTVDTISEIWITTCSLCSAKFVFALNALQLYTTVIHLQAKDHPELLVLGNAYIQHFSVVMRCL